MENHVFSGMKVGLIITIRHKTNQSSNRNNTHGDVRILQRKISQINVCMIFKDLSRIIFRWQGVCSSNR